MLIVVFKTITLLTEHLSGCYICVFFLFLDYCSFFVYIYVCMCAHTNLGVSVYMCMYVCTHKLGVMEMSI